MIGYFAGNFMLTRIGHKYVAELRAKLEAKGLFFEALSYNNIAIRSLKSLSINDVDITFKLDKEIYGKRSFHCSFQAEAIIINWLSIRESEVTFSLSNFLLHVEPAESSEQKTFGDFEQASFSSAIPINLRSPNASAKKGSFTG